MRLRRKKSKKAQAAELLETYVKAKAVSKAAKGATKGVKSSPLKSIPLFVAGAFAAAFVAFKARGGREEATA